MQIYTTRDFYLAAYLHFLGNEISETRLINPNTTVFEFENSKILKHSVEKFYTMKALVDPLSYGSSLRSIKSMIHALKEAQSTSNSGEINNELSNKNRRSISRS